MTGYDPFLKKQIGELIRSQQVKEKAFVSDRETLIKLCRTYGLPEIQKAETDIDPVGICVDLFPQKAKIRIPDMLPHMERKPKYVFLAALEEGLQNRKKKNPEMFSSYQISVNGGAVICFSHSYASSRSVRDHDNIETKAVTDMIVSCGYLPGDAGETLVTMHRSKIQELSDPYCDITIIHLAVYTSKIGDIFD